MPYTVLARRSDPCDVPWPRRRARGVRELSVAVLVLLASAVGCRDDRFVPVPCPDCNVVLISMDTLRADHVGAYGYPRPTTPNVDRVASRGVVFENAIAQSSWTRPAHMSMLTGLYPAEHGFLRLSDRKRLPEATATIASVLSEHGWRTVAFTGGLNVAPDFGFDIGFEAYRTDGRSYRDSADDVVGWLREHRAEKFFLFLHAYDAHTPYHSEDEDRRALGLGPSVDPNGFRRACKQRNAIRMKRYVDAYDAAIHHGDRYVGAVLSVLDELALTDRTIVVFTSDHGEEFLEHGRCFHITTLYREVLHVPLVVAGPNIPARRVTGLVPASVAIGATLLDLVGVGGDPLPGPSLAATLVGAPAHFDAVISETDRSQRGGRGRGHVLAVTRGADKLIEWITEGRYEYFDLASDPGEQQPLSGDRPEIRRLRESLAAWAASHPARLVARPLPSDADHGLRKELRALGYIE